MNRLIWGLILGTMLGSLLNGTPTFSSPGDEFRSDLDRWSDQQRHDSSIREADDHRYRIEPPARRSPC